MVLDVAAILQLNIRKNLSHLSGEKKCIFLNKSKLKKSQVLIKQQQQQVRLLLKARVVEQ
jgi:hypothetical protein